MNNLTRNPYAGGLAIDGEDGGTGAAYNVSMNHMGHPIASCLRDCYQNLVAVGQQNEIPLFAGGGIGKNGNLAANAASLIMLGASGVQVGKYVMQAAAGCLGSESGRCNICNIGLCPKGITSQDPAPVSAVESRRCGPAGGGHVCELRYGTAKDRGPPGPVHIAPHRHVRCAGHRRPEHRGAVENQVCRIG